MLLKPLTETREHTTSYYAATLGEHKQYPALTTAIEADVCVIGGGFSGVSTALHLAERGYNVVLIEANRIGWGATGRNGGQLIGGFSMDPFSLVKSVGAEGARQLWEMGNECVEIVKQRIERHAIDCDLQLGYCDVALKPRHMDYFRDTLARQQALGFPNTLRLLEQEELREHIHSKLYLGGLMNDGYGQLHPLKLCLGEAKAAAELGVAIYEQTRAIKLIPAKGKGQTAEVITEHGSVKARYVAVCCDAYLGELLPELACRNLPASSFIIATEPLGATAKEVMRPSLAVCDLRWALDYFRMSTDNRLIFGGACNYTGLAPGNIEAAMRKKMLHVFPQLGGIRIDYTWGGQIGISLNRIPQIGCLHSNVFYAQGYSGHGVAPTHLMGKLLAEAIDGETQRFDLFARHKHTPFPGGRLLRQPIYALGMLYYRALDWL